MQERQGLRFGGYLLDPDNAHLWRGKDRVLLSPKAFAVLHYLAMHPGRLVSKDDLFRTIWPEVVVSDAALTVCIQEIRKALRDDPQAPRYIETVHRRGYRFIAAVQSLEHGKENGARRSRRSKSTFSHSSSAQYVVGRKTELEQLHVWWREALRGKRQMVFVTGEAGIGKTTVVDTFVEQVGTRGGLWSGRGQCIEHFGIGEPYMPILEALGRLCRAPQGEQALSVLGQYAPTWVVHMPALLNAKDITILQRQGQSATPARMLREMTEALETLADQRPLLLVIEDLHWSDASTLDVLAAVARRREPAKLLIIATYRPGEVLDTSHPLNSVTQDLQAHHLCMELPIEFLSEADIAAYLHLRFPQSLFPTDLVHRLWQQTEGNALFLVSLVEDWLIRKVISQHEGTWVLQHEGEVLAVGVPKSIRQLVARQRLRLQPEEQQVMEAASVAGLEFSAASIAAALEVDLAVAEKRCANLANRQQFLRPAGIEEWPDGTIAARYGFLHVLYQHLWHEQVSISQAQQFHLRIGNRKEQAYSTQAGEIATELAVHFEQNRDYQRAVQYREHAGKNAIGRSAYVEAIIHILKALELLKTQPDTPDRARQELRLQISLGVPLQSTKGFAAPDVEKVYMRARDLCQQLGETVQLFPVLWGLAGFYQVRGEAQKAREFGELLLDLARHTQDRELIVSSYSSLGASLYYLGEFSRALTHFEQGLAYFHPQQHRLLTFRYVHSPGVFCQRHAALALWCLGYPDQALRRAKDALALAQELAHPFSLTFALFFIAWLHQLRREDHIVQEQAEEMIQISKEQGFMLPLAFGIIQRGWALTERTREEEGTTLICQGLTNQQATGAKLARTYFLALLAQGYLRVGQLEKGLTVANEALDAVDRLGERFYEAELYRLKGELTLQQFKVQGSKLKVENLQPTICNPQSEAEACFLKAIEIARRQQAKSWELRATMDLVRLRQQQALGQGVGGKEQRERSKKSGRRSHKQEARTRLAEAHQMLSEIYGWFTEGFDTKDLQDAKRLIKELS